MNLFETNRQHLEGIFPRLKSEVFEKFQPADGLSIQYNRNGVASAQLGSRWIHSKHNPHREAERFIDISLSGKTSDHAVFLGFGLGYQIEEFFRRCPQGEAIVIEQRADLFLKALTSRDFRSLFTKKISLLIGLAAEELPRALAPLIERNHVVLPLVSITQSAPEYYSYAEAVIQSERSRKQVNSTTVKRFGRRWVRNLARNIETMCTASSLNRLENLFSGVPALVIAAGPSLDLALPFLKQLQQRMLLIATDTSLQALARSGITPDFAVVVDPQYWNSRHLDGLEMNNTILISESASHPNVFRHTYRALFFSGSIFPLGSYLEALDEPPYKLGAGGSVTTTAWDFARFIGADQIYLSGLDLGFPEKRTHYRGSFFEERLFSLSTRLNPYEGLIFDYLHNGEPFYHENYSGGQTLTDKRLIIYRQWFEEQLSASAGSTYTLSPEGIKINGILTADIQELHELSLVRDFIDVQLEGLVKHYRTHLHSGAEQRYELIRNRLAGLVEELQELRSAAADGLKIVKEAIGTFEETGTPESVPQKLAPKLHRLDKIDQRLLHSSSRYVAGFLINPILEEVQDELYKQQNLRKSLESSLTIYRHLLDSALFHIELLKPN